MSRDVISGQFQDCKSLAKRVAVAWRSAATVLEEGLHEVNQQLMANKTREATAELERRRNVKKKVEERGEQIRGNLELLTGILQSKTEEVAILDAEIGRYGEGAETIAERILGKLKEDAAKAASTCLPLKKEADELATRLAVEQAAIENLEKVILEQQLDVSEGAHARVLASADSCLAALLRHLATIDNWSEMVGFSDLPRARKVSEIYVALDAFVSPVKQHVSAAEKQSLVPMNDVLGRGSGHCVILGQPGAGKTTSIKKVCRDLLSAISDEAGCLPLLLRFREMKVGDVDLGRILDYFAGALGLEMHLNSTLIRLEGASQSRQRKVRALYAFFESLGVLLLLDGYDETPGSIERSELVGEIRHLAATLKATMVVVTCRTGEFNHSIDHARLFEVAPLSSEQVRSFASRWIASASEAERFCLKVLASPFGDTAMRPLALAHLCAIYQRTGDIPDRPKTVYRKIVELLIQDWDDQRSVRRFSSYARFERDRKFEFLCALAYMLTVEIGGSVFSRAQFVECYRMICDDFGLDSSRAEDVVAEVESHTGLFLQGGYDSYEFAHKSLQEYLTAEHIVRLPAVPNSESVLKDLGHELAVATAISSNPSAYFAEVALNVVARMSLPREFFDAFISRLAQEKPSFNSDERVVVAAASLLSNWIRSSNSSEGRANVKGGYVGRDLGAVAALFKQLLEKNDVQLLREYYESRREKRTDANTVYLRRTKRMAGYSLPEYLLLPREWFGDGLLGL